MFKSLPDGGLFLEKYHEIKRGRGETVAGTAKKVEELNVQLFDEIDFEDTAPFRESPDAWRMLIYEEICADEKYRRQRLIIGVLVKFQNKSYLEG